MYEQFGAKDIECSLAAAAKVAAGKKYSTWSSTPAPTSYSTTHKGNFKMQQSTRTPKHSKAKAKAEPENDSD